MQSRPTVSWRSSLGISRNKSHFPALPNTTNSASSQN